jgi:hypothetical protein
MGGAASMLKKHQDKQEEGAGAEGEGHEADDERENMDANASSGKLKAGFRSLRKSANRAMNKALAKIGLDIEEEDSPSEEEDGTPVHRGERQSLADASVSAWRHACATCAPVLGLHTLCSIADTGCMPDR